MSKSDSYGLETLGSKLYKTYAVRSAMGSRLEGQIKNRRFNNYIFSDDEKEMLSLTKPHLDEIYFRYLNKRRKLLSRSYQWISVREDDATQLYSFDLAGPDFSTGNAMGGPHLLKMNGKIRALGCTIREGKAFEMFIKDRNVKLVWYDEMDARGDSVTIGERAANAAERVSFSNFFYQVPFVDNRTDENRKRFKN